MLVSYYIHKPDCQTLLIVVRCVIMWRMFKIIIVACGEIASITDQLISMGFTTLEYSQCRFLNSAEPTSKAEITNTTTGVYKICFIY